MDAGFLRHQKTTRIEIESMLESAVICHQGRVRERNEDSVLEERELGLWAVADGVGGSMEWSLRRILANDVMGMWQLMHWLPELSFLWNVCAVAFSTRCL